MLVGLRSMNGVLVFVDILDCMVMNIVEYYMVFDVEWDFIGCYVVIFVFWWSYKVDNVYWLWIF